MTPQHLRVFQWIHGTTGYSRVGVCIVGTRTGIVIERRNGDIDCYMGLVTPRSASGVGQVMRCALGDVLDMGSDIYMVECDLGEAHV